MYLKECEPLSVSV